MRKLVSKIYNRYYDSVLVVGFIAAILLILLNLQTFSDFVTNPYISGWDGAAHASIGYQYYQSIFPHTWGWLPIWYKGMPFPQFYPPVFYFLIAVLAKVLPVSYFWIFKGVILLTMLSIPGLIFWLAKVLTKSASVSWLSVGGVLLLLSWSDDLSYSGITVQATFNNGLFPQLLAYVFFLCWVRFFIEYEKKFWYPYAAGISLALILLTNVHIVPLALIFMAVGFAFEAGNAWRKRSLKDFLPVVRKYLIMGGAPLLAAAFWYLPMLANYNYMVGIPIKFILPIDVNTFLYRWALFLLLLLVGFLLSVWKRQKLLTIVGIASFISILIIFIWPDKLLPGIVIQTSRWLAPILVLDMIFAGYFFSVLLSYVSHKKIKIVLVVILFAIPLSILWLNARGRAEWGFYTTSSQDRLQDIVSTLKTATPGNVMVEVDFSGGEPRFQVFNSILADEGIATNFIVFRESSLASLFMVPITDSLSIKNEDWGMRSYLATNPKYLKLPIDHRLKNADLVGIQYFLLRTREMKNQFNSSTLATLVKDFGRWSLYEYKNPSPEVFVPQYEPTLLFAPRIFKERPIDGYNYIRFQEILLKSGNIDITLASPHDFNLDTTPDLDRFNSAIISEYKYENLDAAYNRLAKYSQDRELYLVSDTDPLFTKLAALNSSHIRVYARMTASKLLPDPLDSQLSQLFLDMKLTAKPLSATSVAMTSSAERITLNLATTTQAVPIITKINYFPAWEATNGEKPYIVSPTFMMTFASSSTALEFKTPRSLKVGLGISILTLLGVIGSFILKTKSQVLHRNQ
jgi:hypothetical protein